MGGRRDWQFLVSRFLTNFSISRPLRSCYIVRTLYTMLYYVLVPICAHSICIILPHRHKYSASLQPRRNLCQPPLRIARRPSRANGGAPFPAPMVALPLRRLLTSVRPTPVPKIKYIIPWILPFPKTLPFGIPRPRQPFLCLIHESSLLYKFQFVRLSY